MKKILISALMISIITVSCKKEEEIPVVKTNEVESTVFLESIGGSNNASTQAAPEVVNATTSPNQGQTSAAVANGINPAHGQPGHRCDISVGAPLNSAPGKANIPAATPIKNTVDVSANAQKQNVSSSSLTSGTVSNATPPGMNPPHGQAGHVCSVAVGAPLPAK